MPAIQIQLLTGPGAGRRAAFPSAPITFGRDADNTLVITDAFVSRHHGRLDLDDQQQWVLHNLSPNGTEVSGRKVTGKPRRLRDQDVIAVGGQAVFKVAFEAEVADASPAAALAAAPSAAGPSLSRRTKIWTGIGIWTVGLVVFFVIVMSIIAGKSAGRAAGMPPRLLPAQIEAEIRKPPEAQSPNEQYYRLALDEARTLNTQWRASPSQLLPTYRAYQRALSFSGKPYFAGTDQLHLNAVRDALIDEITRRYEDAYTKLKTQDYRSAADAFERLSRYFHEPASPIFQNVMAMQNYAQKLRGK